MFPKWFWCTLQLTVTLPAARSPLTSPDPQAGWTQVRTLISRGGAGLKERNMRNRYSEHLPGRGHLAYFSSTLSLCPRTLLASFPDWTALLVLLSVPVGQAGMQQTGLAIMALAVCAALHASEGEWGHWPLRPPLEGWYLPNLCWKDWGGARIAISSSRNFQLISDYLPGNDIGLNSRSPISFRKEPHSNRAYCRMRSFHIGATSGYISFSDDGILENPQLEAGVKLLLFICLPPHPNLLNCLNTSVHIPGGKDRLGQLRSN